MLAPLSMTRMAWRVGFAAVALCVGLALSKTVRVGEVRLLPLVAVQNLGGVHSVGSVSVNATGGKFFEPAPGRTLLVRIGVARADSEP